jgi:cell division transport system ATP-binding protein
VVTLEHIGKRYDGSVPVLTDVSLTLETGAFHFLTGASGAGKTTLLKIITLAERPSHGRLPGPRCAAGSASYFRMPG